MAGSPTYLDYATTQDNSLRDAMDQIISASLNTVSPAIRWLAILYIIITFCLLASNMLTLSTMIGRLVRLLFVNYVITGTGVYVKYVRDFAFDQLPQTIAATLTGNPTLTSAAQQFDTVSLQAEGLVGGVEGKITWFTSHGIGDAVSAWAAGGGIEALNGIMFGVFETGRVLLAVVLCFGPWLLLFELFDRTRGFVEHWIGIGVGLLVFGLGTSVLLQLAMQGEAKMLIALHNSSFDVDMMVSQLLHVVGFLLVDIVALIGLPAVCAVGSGAAVSHAAATGMVGAALGRGVTPIGSIGAPRAGTAAISSAVRSGVRSAFRSPSSS